jgi:hypothetical protein
MLIISRDWIEAPHSKKLNQMDIVNDTDPRTDSVACFFHFNKQDTFAR